MGFDHRQTTWLIDDLSYMMKSREVTAESFNKKIGDYIAQINRCSDYDDSKMTKRLFDRVLENKGGFTMENLHLFIQKFKETQELSPTRFGPHMILFVDHMATNVTPNLLGTYWNLLDSVLRKMNGYRAMDKIYDAI